MEYVKSAGHKTKMVLQAASSTTNSETTESVEKRVKRYVDDSKDRSKTTFLVHGPGHSSYECMVLGYVGFKYNKSRRTKDHGQEPTKMISFFEIKITVLLFSMQCMR